MGITDDRNDPCLDEIQDDGQQACYLVLSDEERAKGFVRPVRTSYQHVGVKPQYSLRDLTLEEHERYDKYGYVKYEEYPPADFGASGKFWTEKTLNSGCGVVTTMGLSIAETYSRDPSFYGGTFCAGCGAHFPVGEHGEFVWNGTDERVGT